MSDYAFMSFKETPQSEPIPGKAMVKNRAGGYGFEVPLKDKVRRGLLFGTTENAYYADRRELTTDLINALTELAKQDAPKLADIIVECAERPFKMSPPIFALAVMSIHCPVEFRRVFNNVVRTASHLLEFVSYVRNLRGWGQTVSKAVNAWIVSREDLAYQALKYRGRTFGKHRWDLRDVVRLTHLKGDKHPEIQPVLQWLTKGAAHESLEQIRAWERFKESPDPELIRKHRLTHEMVTGTTLDKKCWQALFENMPMTALIRNLRVLTNQGVLDFFNRPDNLDRLEAKLTDRGILAKARIHPMQLLVAHRAYSRSEGAVPRVVDILDAAINVAWSCVEPMNAPIVLSLDISPSMESTIGDRNPISYCEVGAVMALALAKKEKQYLINGFSTEYHQLDIRATDSIDTAARKAIDRNWGGTDASLPFLWAEQKGIQAHHIMITDNETWAGRIHPQQAFDRYKKVCPWAKVIYVTIGAYGEIRLNSPDDPTGMDVVGFDPQLPELIRRFLVG